MKKIISLALIGLISLFGAWQAQATTILPDDLNDLDSLLGDCILADSGPTAEAECFNTVLAENSIDYTVTEDQLVQIEFSDDPLAAEEIFEVDDGLNTIAIEIDPDTEYFLIKTGNLGGTDINAYVFENNDSFDWAYIDLSDTLILEIAQISHLTQVVPVPAAAWLFGSALLGLVGVARRRKA
jgi:hypothetical protein